MPQPTDIPAWNTGGSNRTAPPSGQVTSGYVVSSALSSGYLNWLFYTIYTWIVYLKNLTSEVLSWTHLQTFLAGIFVTSPSGGSPLGAQNNDGMFATAYFANLGTGLALALTTNGTDALMTPQRINVGGVLAGGDIVSGTKLSAPNAPRAFGSIHWNHGVVALEGVPFNVASASSPSPGNLRPLLTNPVGHAFIEGTWYGFPIGGIAAQGAIIPLAFGSGSDCTFQILSAAGSVVDLTTTEGHASFMVYSVD
jgi:hypothetical protein